VIHEGLHVLSCPFLLLFDKEFTFFRIGILVLFVVNELSSSDLGLAQLKSY
jgi:hypothetical protein